MSVECSAPGKVLIVGGYLILDRPNKGLVISTTARFHSKIEKGKSLSNRSDIPIRVCSPQFSVEHQIMIQFNEESSSFMLVGESVDSVPVYVRLCLQIALGLSQRMNSDSDSFWSSLENGITITLCADNDFYSQQQLMETRGLAKSMESYSKLQPFEKVDGSLQEVRKTGLGSSATLVSSLLSALFIFFGAIKLNKDGGISENDKNYLHNVAQVVHCAAQGKVGSGFDISTAIFGSQNYIRFSKTIIEPVLSQIDKLNRENYDSIIKEIQELCSDTNNWDNSHIPFQLPPMLSMTLGDVNAGANTPKMVSKLLQWKKDEPELANTIWNHLNENNDKVAVLFSKLKKYHEDNSSSYVETLTKCSTVSWNKWNELPNTNTNITNTLIDIHNVFVDIRKSLRTMGDNAGVPIEPKEQTKLLDSTMELPGVISAAVPGAGGFDALYAIVIDIPNSNVMEQLEKHWVEWKELSVLPQLVREDPAGGIITII